MRSVGIDISTKTGVVVLEATNSKINVLHEEEVSYPALKGMERADLLSLTVQKIIKDYNCDSIVLEDYGFGARKTMIILAEITTLIRHKLYQNSLDYNLIAPAQLKKFITGSGKAEKNSILLNVFKKWGFEAKTDNTADAFGLAMIGLALKNKLELTQYQKQAIDKISLIKNH